MEPSFLPNRSCQHKKTIDMNEKVNDQKVNLGQKFRTKTVTAPTSAPWPLGPGRFGAVNYDLRWPT